MSVFDLFSMDDFFRFFYIAKYWNFNRIKLLIRIFFIKTWNFFTKMYLEKSMNQFEMKKRKRLPDDFKDIF